MNQLAEGEDKEKTNYKCHIRLSKLISKQPNPMEQLRWDITQNRTLTTFCLE